MRLLVTIKMVSFQDFIIFVLILFLYNCEGRISNERLCADPDCSEAVSYGKTLIQYYSDDPRILSFKKNVDCTIYSKSAGSRLDLWGVEINGKRGYVPKNFVRERRILKSKLSYVVPTEPIKTTKNNSENATCDKSAPSNVETETCKTKDVDRTVENVEHSGMEPLTSSGILHETPSLTDTSSFNLPFPDIYFPSFPGSGVSAEPIENENPSNRESMSQPFEVIEGTTVYYGTDGGESNIPSLVQPTQTTVSVEASASPEQSDKTESEPTAPPAVVKAEPQSTNTKDVKESVESVDNKETVFEGSAGRVYQYVSSLLPEGSGATDKDTKVEATKDSSSTSDDVLIEGSGRGGGNEETVGSVKTESSESESKVEPILEHKKESEFDSQSKVETSESVPQSNVVTEPAEEVKVVSEKVSESEKDMKGEPKTGQAMESEEDIDEDDEDGVEYDDEDEEEDDELDDEESEDEATTPEPIKEKKSVSEELQSVETSGSTKESPDTEVLGNETSSSIAGNASEDVPLKMGEGTEGSVKKVLLQGELPEIIVEATEPSISEYTIHEPVLGDQAVAVNDTEATGSEETKDVHETSEESEKNDVNMQTTTNDAPNQFDSVANTDKLEEKEVIGENIETVQGSDVSEDISGQLETLKSEHEPINILNSENMSSQREEVELTTEPFRDEQTYASTTDDIETVTQPSDESYYGVSSYPSTEETTTSVPDYVTQATDSVEATSEEIGESSEGFFSGIADSLSASLGSLTSMFSSSSPDGNIAEESEEVNESTAEKIQEADDAKEINRKRDVRDAAWSSLWGGPSEEHVTLGSRNQPLDDEMDRKSSACKVDYDPSAGIDSDCSDVSGDLPSIRHQPEDHPIEPDDSVTVKFPEDDNLIMDLQRSSYDTLLYLVITAVTVLLFSLGHYYIEKKRRDGTLVAKINELEKELLVSSKECLILKDDLQVTKEKLLSIESSSTDSDVVVTSLNAQLEESKNARTELEEQIVSLEKELEAATEAGLELNRMLTEFLTAQHGSDTVMKSVEQLQKQLDSQQSTIATMTASLSAKNTENEALQGDLTAAKEKISSLEEDMKKVNENLNDVLSQKLEVEAELSDKNKLLQTRLDEMQERKNLEIEQLRKEVNTLQEKLNEQNDNLVTKESEVTVLQDCLKQLKHADEEGGEDKLQALLDVGHTKAELKLMTIERDTLAEKLQGEEDARRLLEDHVNVITEQVNKLRESYEEAEKDKIEAQTRLEVLSNYFKEKETQLQKELGLQEAMCIQKEGDATSTYERIKSLEEEIENYKSQNETLKKEILDQERGLKCQIATLEKKAHENWVAARQAERKLEESKQEASQLRNRLTIVEKNVTNVSKNGETTKMNDRLTGDSNGELPTSPVHMGISNIQDSSSSPLHYQHHEGIPASPPLPAIIPGQPLPPSPFMGMPPPGVFMPPPPPGAPFMPPPPPLFPGDRRPPPLGRMSSPPPHHYSPPPPDHRGTFSPYDHSPSPSPPPRPYRTPPRHEDDSPDRFRQHRSPPPPHFSPYTSASRPPPPHWDDPHGNPRSGFRPLPPPTHRDSPREPKGSAMSSGHSSESLEKSSRHSGRV